MTRADKLRIQLADTRAHLRHETQRIRSDRSKNYREQDALIAELEEQTEARVQELLAAIPQAEREDRQEQKERADAYYKQRYTAPITKNEEL